MAATVAVVGAGAWGTTLARLIAKTEPVTLLCHSPATAARIAATRRNEARLPGVQLPVSLVATADIEQRRGGREGVGLDRGEELLRGGIRTSLVEPTKVALGEGAIELLVGGATARGHTGKVAP